MSRRWLTEHPVGGFVALVFAISYLVGGPILIAVLGFAAPDAVLVRTYGARLLVVYGPATAALVMAGVTRRDGGPMALLRQIIPRANDVLLAVGLIVAGAALAAAVLITSGVTASNILAVVGHQPGLLAAHWILQTLVVAIGEELGWRGWLLPELGTRTSRLNAALSTGAIWALWHGPLLIGNLVTVTSFVAGVFGLSGLFAWIRWRLARSLFPVVVAHASVNAPFFFWEQATTGPSATLLARSWILAEASFVVVAIVVVSIEWRWWIRPERAATPPAAPAPDRYGARDESAQRAQRARPTSAAQPHRGTSVDRLD